MSSFFRRAGILLALLLAITMLAWLFQTQPPGWRQAVVCFKMMVLVFIATMFMTRVSMLLPLLLFSAVAFGWLFEIQPFGWVKVALLSGTICFTTMAILLPFRHFSMAYVPQYAHPNIAGLAAMSGCCVYYLMNGESQPWKYVWIVLTGMLLLRRLPQTLFIIAMATSARLHLAQGYKRGIPPRLSPPYVIVMNAGRFSRLRMAQFIILLVERLHRFRFQPEESAFEINLNTLTVPAFITVDELSMVPTAFRNYVIEHAVGIIAAPAGLGRFNAMMIDAEGTISSQPRPKVDNLKSILLLNIAKLIDPKGKLITHPELSADEMKSAILWSIVTAGHKHYLRERDLLAAIHHAHGPAIILVSDLQLVFTEAAGENANLHGYEVLSAEKTRILHGSVCAHTVGILSNTALPMARSDAQLSTALRELIPTLGRRGLPPLVDCYLRFRLSASSVERSMCLFDCFEVLIKYSLLVLLANENECYTDDTFKNLSQPSLGAWGKLLQRRINLPGENANRLVTAVCQFWERPLAEAPAKFVDAVNGAGLSWPDAIPRSHIAWLGWLAWFRNQTKGHGAVEEHMCNAIWHDFHVTLLEAVIALKDLTHGACMCVKDSKGREIPMQGWLRGPFRSSTLDRSVDWPQPRQPLPPILVLDDLRLELSPFVVFTGNTCWTWKSGDRESGDYIDYATGRIQQLKPKSAVAKTVM